MRAAPSSIRFRVCSLAGFPNPRSAVRSRALWALDERAVDDDGRRRLRAGGRGEQAAPGDARADGEVRKIPRASADEQALVVRVGLALFAGHVGADAVE